MRSKSPQRKCKHSDRTFGTRFKGSAVSYYTTTHLISGRLQLGYQAICGAGEAPESPRSNGILSYLPIPGTTELGSPMCPRTTPVKVHFETTYSVGEMRRHLIETGHCYMFHSGLSCVYVTCALYNQHLNVCS